MNVRKYIIYFTIEGDVSVLLVDNELPSLELDENVTIFTVDKILDNLHFYEVYKYHSELSEIDQTNELHIVEYCLVGNAKLRKGEFKGIFNVEKDNNIYEKHKGC